MGSGARRTKRDSLTRHDTRIRATHAFIASLLLVCASACGGTTTTGPSTAGSSSGGSASSSGGSASSSGGSCASSGGPTAADFSSREAALFCDTLEPCCAGAQFPFDQAACEKYIGSDFQSQLSIVGSGAAFDCAAGQRCLDEVASAIQGCSAFDKAQLPDCNHLFVGTLPVGTPCTDSNECAAPIDVYGECMLDASMSGTCALAPSEPRGKLGDTCGESCDPYGECAVGTSDPPPIVSCYQSDGLYCSAGHCVPIAAVGASCTNEDGCAPGVLCLNSSDQGQSPNDAMPGKCIIPPPNGLLATPYLCLGMPDPNQN
jgi:hypothetical protein